MHMSEETDLKKERFAKVDRQVQEALSCYKLIYSEKKTQSVQSMIYTFFEAS